MLKPIVVLVFGGNGWIGSKVVKLLQKSNTTVIKSSCRADDVNAIQKEIADSQLQIARENKNRFDNNWYLFSLGFSVGNSDSCLLMMLMTVLSTSSSLIGGLFV